MQVVFKSGFTVLFIVVLLYIAVSSGTTPFLTSMEHGQLITNLDAGGL